MMNSWEKIIIKKGCHAFNLDLNYDKRRKLINFLKRQPKQKEV